MAERCSNTSLNGLAFVQGECRRRDGGSRTKPETPHQAEARCSLLRVWGTGAHQPGFHSRADFFNRLKNRASQAVIREARQS